MDICGDYPDSHGITIITILKTTEYNCHWKNAAIIMITETLPNQVCCSVVPLLRDHP